jgi:NADP-dependent 3-hydroxy acid dehydrogenase YdfG
MSKTILVCGYGPGISDAVARKFGGEGFSVALVARRDDKVRAGAAALAEAGITAQGFACDLGDPAAVKKLVSDVRAALGPITVIHYNAYPSLAGDLTSCDPADVQAAMSVGVTGLVVAMQESLPDLRAQDGAAILVTGGGFALYSPQADAMIAQYGAMGLGLVKATQHKLVGVLNAKLKDDGVYVGEVMVLGMVKGTAFDSGHATIEPAAVADRFLEIYESRAEVCVTVGG